jgi:glycosyltransferase involved in cell wall biosynthesis
LSAPSTLSVLVPIYNERATIERLLTEVAAVDTGLRMEILAGDDGSSDGTREILSRLQLPGLRVIFMPDNVGRGGVLKHLWTLATGDIYVHQDADLEYDPRDYLKLLQPIREGAADVVYGSRFKGSIEGMRFANRLGNLFMSASARLLYGAQVSDLMTCYKMYRASLIKGLSIRANGFDFEAEFTARLAQRGARFAEAPISFRGRTFAEGKKIRAFDAVRVMRELVRCRVSGATRG